MSFLQQPPQNPEPEPDKAEQAEQIEQAPTAEGTAPLPGREDAPQVPVAPQGATEDDVKALLRQFMADQQKWRSQVVQEVRAGRTPPPAPAAGETVADRKAARDAAIAQAPYYCPNCGKLHQFLRECVGPLEAQHPPVVTVPTDELHNEPDPRDREEYADWQAGHTIVPDLAELSGLARAR